MGTALGARVKATQGTSHKRPIALVHRCVRAGPVCAAAGFRFGTDTLSMAPNPPLHGCVCAENESALSAKHIKHHVKDAVVTGRAVR